MYQLVPSVTAAATGPFTRIRSTRTLALALIPKLSVMRTTAEPLMLAEL